MSIAPRNWLVMRNPKNRICPDCGGTDFREATEYYKAHCHIQYLIDTSLFCYDCQSPVVKYLLDHPRTSCDDCEGTPVCPSSPAAAAATKLNYPIHQERSVNSPKTTGYRPCKRGESPRPKKSGYGWHDRNEIEKGNVRYNEKEGIWEKRID